MVTPFLALQNIQEAITILLNGTILTLIRKFKRYFQRQWMQRVTPKGFTVFYQPRATNNGVEYFHIKLKVRPPNKTPNV